MFNDVQVVSQTKVVFICATCGKVSTTIQRCSHCSSTDLHECEVVREEQGKYVRAIVDRELFSQLVHTKASIIVATSNVRQIEIMIFKNHDAVRKYVEDRIK